jgi:uncharacterized protein (TIGR02147 family)
LIHFDWYHFGLIELLKITGVKSADSAWMAKRLGIQPQEAKMALERLCRLELVTNTKQGWKVNQDTVFTTDGVPSEALRKFHKQVLEKASAAITLQTIEERYLSSSMMPINTQDLPKAYAIIQEFREKFSAIMSKEQDGNNVYALSVQFFNLTNQGEVK